MSRTTRLGAALAAFLVWSASLMAGAQVTIPVHDAASLAAFDARYNEAQRNMRSEDDATFERGLSAIVDLCDAYYGKACYWYGDAMISSGNAENRKAAIHYFNLGCQGRFASACTRAAIMLEDGEVVPQDLETAAAYRDEACKHKDKTGCFASGHAFAQATYGTPDYTKARRYLAISCDTGEARGCKDLGVLQDKGLGGPPDQTAALANYRKACAGHDASGCYNVAVAAYNNWPGTSATDKEKIEGFLDACELGSASACDIAAKLTSGGLGLSLYPDRSERSRSLACTLDKQYCE